MSVPGCVLYDYLRIARRAISNRHHHGLPSQCSHPAWAPKEHADTHIVARDYEVGESILVEIATRECRWITGCNGNHGLWAECPVPVSWKNRNASRPEVGKREVQVAITVEVREDEIIRHKPYNKVPSRQERATRRAQENRHGVRLRPGHYHVHSMITVYIAGGEIARGVPHCVVRDFWPKRAVLVAIEVRDHSSAHREVQVSVPVEVTGRHIVPVDGIGLA